MQDRIRNVHPKPQALPGNGIYATIAQVDGKKFPSATNIGIRPTFGEGEKTVETHLLNYKGDLYGKDIRLEFVQKLRDEQRFPSSEELKVQIEKDVREVEAILAKDVDAAEEIAAEIINSLVDIPGLDETSEGFLFKGAIELIVGAALKWVEKIKAEKEDSTDTTTTTVS